MKDKSTRLDADGLHKRGKFWHYALTIDGQRRFFSTKTSSYQEARRVRAKAEADQKAGLLPNDLSRWQFQDLHKHVRQQRAMHISEGTARIEKERSVRLLEFFAGWPVKKIDARAISAYQQKRSKVVKARTINLEISVLRTILKAAKTWASIQPDYQPLKENRVGPGRALSEAEERLLMDTAASRVSWDVAFYAAMVAANTSARGVELKNLRIGDVNLLDSEVSIGVSKTGAGLRKIPLNAAAQWALARLLERANTLGSIEPEHYLFPAFRYRRTRKEKNQATPFDPTRPQRTWRGAWRALVAETSRVAGRGAAREALDAGKDWRGALAAWRRAAAVFRGLRFHDLRHHAITTLAEGLASDATVMSISGHLSRKMLEHYSHVRSDAKRKAVETMPAYIPSKKSATTNTTKTVQ